MIWPDGKKFAFTVVDDTDRATVANTKPVYDFLRDHGVRTTKTVWLFRPLDRPATGGESLEDREYLRWILELKARGVEVALHGVADGSSNRERVADGLDKFKDLFGEYPSIHVNHVGQKEGMYWGASRFDGWVRTLYRCAVGDGRYAGHREDSEYFWGDLCRSRVRFVRNLTFTDINTLKMDPLMPYHDHERPYVNYWFSSSQGSGLENYCRLLSEENQERLAAEGGACIVYTHFGSSGFGKLSARFTALMRRLAGLPGWFVPASTLLEYVGRTRGWKRTADHPGTREQLQRRWLAQQLRYNLGARWRRSR